jgi:uncharacterized membrane protein
MQLAAVQMRALALALALALAWAIGLSACVSAAISGRGADGTGAATAESIASHLIARGTEPFWAIEVDGNRLVWKTPDRPEGVVVLTERRVESNGVRYVAADADAFELAIAAGRCSDGMSDLEYPFTATWTHGDRTWRGCALPRE